MPGRIRSGTGLKAVTAGRGDAMASSSSRSALSVVMGAMPMAARAATSVSVRWAVMPVRSSQRPQATEVAGSPWVRRWWARASRKALAAA